MYMYYTIVFYNLHSYLFNGLVKHSNIASRIKIRVGNPFINNIHMYIYKYSEIHRLE